MTWSWRGSFARSRSRARFRAQVRAFLREARQVTLSMRWVLGSLLGTAIVSTCLLFPHDPALLDGIRVADARTDSVATLISTFGRFEYSTLGLALVGLLAHGIRRERNLKTAATAALLAGLLGGLGVDVLRPTLGRARPSAQAANGLYFLSLDHQFQSLPSGHATSVAATLTAMAVVLPAATLPAALAIAVVGWSRLQVGRHYPSDVLSGTLLGIAIGLVVGKAIERMRAAQREHTGRAAGERSRVAGRITRTRPVERSRSDSGTGRTGVG